MTEKQLHKQICDYLHMQYPKVLFNTDMSGIKLTIGQATQSKKLRSHNGFPDIVIYERSIRKTNFPYQDIIYNALFLEVKKESPFKKDGQLKKNEHLEEQQFMINILNSKYYLAEFVWTFEMAKELIDKYLNNGI